MNDIKETTKYVLRFAKTGKIKFIGHLDLLKVFQSAIRRAALPVAYSQGYNPHPLLTFALPLPLGMESVCDYAELTVEASITPEAIQTRLNDHLPDGLRVSAVWAWGGSASGGGPSGAGLSGGGLAARTAAAAYALIVSVYAPDCLNALLAEPSIVVSKKTKRGVHDADIRPDILALCYTAEDTIYMRLCAGSARHLNPYLAAQVVANAIGVPDCPPIVRLNLFGADGKQFDWFHEESIGNQSNCKPFDGDHPPEAQPV